MPLSLEMRKRIIKMLAGFYASSGSTVTFPSTIYLGLSTTAPNADGTGITEPEGNGYQRMRLDGFYTLGQQAGSSTYALNAFPTEPTYDSETGKYSMTSINDVYFVEPTGGSWGTCTHFIICSNQSAGSGDLLIAYGQLISPITPVPNTIPVIRAGDLIIEEE